MDKARKGCLTFALVSILAKALGAIYRIPLTNLLGANGIGIYQTVFPLYALIIAITSGAIPAFLSREIAIADQANDGLRAKKLFNTSLFSAVFVGLALSCFVVALAKPLANLQGVEKGEYCYYAIAPSIFFVGILSVFRGYYNAKLKLSVTAFSLLCEQAFKLALGLASVVLWGYKGKIFSVSLALFAVTASEILTVAVLAVMYFAKGNRISGGFVCQKESLFLKALPLIIGGMLLPLSSFVDSILTVKLLMHFGEQQQNALASYGILSGGVNTIINFPVMLTLAIATTVIPLVAKSYEKKDIDGIRNTGGKTIKYTLGLSIPCVLGVIILSSSVISMLYPALQEQEKWLFAKLLTLCSINIVLLSMLQLLSSLLSGITYSRFPAVTLFVSVIVKIIATVLLIKPLGIYGVAIASIICYALAVLADGLYYVYLTGKIKNLSKWLLQILISGAIMVGTIVALGLIIEKDWLLTLIGISVGAIVYALCLILTKFFTKQELLSFLPKKR